MPAYWFFPRVGGRVCAFIFVAFPAEQTDGRPPEKKKNLPHTAQPQSAQLLKSCLLLLDIGFFNVDCEICEPFFFFGVSIDSHSHLAWPVAAANVMPGTCYCDISLKFDGYGNPISV